MTIAFTTSVGSFRRGFKWLLTIFMAHVFMLPCKAQKITIHEKDMSFPEVFREIQHQTGINVIFSPETLIGAPTVNLDYKGVDIRQLLKNCFTGLELGYNLYDKVLTIFRKVNFDISLYIPVEGRVQSADGELLEGASISVDGLPPQITRAGGIFRLPVRALRTAAFISFQGYSPRKVWLTNDEFQVVSLQRMSSTLDQVVVQAYGKTTTRLATGSVTTVRESDINSAPSGNILGGLEGKVPGMIVRQNNGVPGSAYSVLIRGRQSISQGTDPLIVVDGVPIAFNDSYVSTIGTGSAQGPGGASDLNGIPLSAIASIEVLKGAAATAIYGSRGANGVILLTLKMGATGRLKWVGDIYTGTDQGMKTGALLNTSQYLNLRKEAVENDGLPVNATTVPELYLWDSSRYTNFKQLVMGHTRLRENARIDVSGGDSGTIFLLSGNYHGEAAVFPGPSSDDRMSLYGHLHHQSGNRRFRLDLSALYSWENNLLPIEDYTYFGALAPNAPSFLDSAGQPSWNSNGISYLNIPALENNTYRASVTNQFNHLQLAYDLLPGLMLRTSVGYYRIGSVERSEDLIGGQDPASDPVNQTFYTGNHSQSELVEGLAEYKRVVGPGQLESLVGVNWQGQQTNYSGINANYLLSLNGNSGTTITGNDSSLVYRYEAVFGRVNYVIKNRYIATFSGRRDGSSRFGPGNQFGNFWAAGAAWIFSDEPFLRQWRWLSFGKLRGSLGTTGNDEIGSNGYAQVYSTQNVTRGYQGVQGLLPTTFSDAGLRWEVNYSSELALDLGFLQNRILISANAYRDWTTNQLLYISLASQSGLPGVEQNVPAKVTNIGLELSLQTYNWTSSHFRWISTISLTAPANRLARFPDLSNSAFASQLVVGQSLSVVKGYHYMGVDPATGLFQFRHMDGNSGLDIQDMVAGGNTDVHYYGGCNQSLRYKDWQLDLFFEFRLQGGVNPYVILYQENPPGFAGPSMISNAPVQWLHRWQHPGDHAALQQVTESYGSAAYTTSMDYISSDASVTNASFMRWKSMTLSYRLPQKWLARLAVRECRMYLEGQNLLTWTHFPVTDPETQNPTVLPPVRSVAAGLHVML